MKLRPQRQGAKRAAAAFARADWAEADAAHARLAKLDIEALAADFTSLAAGHGLDVPKQAGNRQHRQQ